MSSYNHFKIYKKFVYKNIHLKNNNLYIIIIMETTVDSSTTNINSIVSSTSFEGIHKLNTNWVIWYHSPSDKSWTIDSYKSILEIETLEDYLVLQNSWLECLPSVNEGMFFVMRKFNNGKTILPQWEDVNNKKGGYWSFKVDNSEAQDVWYKLCQFTIGETICKKVSDQLTINGISISPKKTFCIIKIWNSDCNSRELSLLSSELNFLNIEEAQYSSHNNNIERDTAKVNRYKERMRERDNSRRGNGGRGSGRSFRNNIGRF